MVVTTDKLQEITQHFNKLAKEKLEARIECLAFVGSYAAGKISFGHPDINYLLVWKDRATADDYLVLGNVLSETVAHFRKFQINFEFRPFKFSHPAKSDKPEVFINISLFNLSDKAGNFFIPAFVLEGFQQTQKVIFGNDVLGAMKLEVSKKSILDATPQKLASHKVHIDRLPLVYNIRENTAAFFNETLDHGKNLAYFGIELAMDKKEIANKDYLTIVTDKDKLQKFYVDNFPESVGGAIKTILDSRNNYSQWKNDSQKAEGLYKAVFVLHNMLMGLYLKQTP